MSNMPMDMGEEQPMDNQFNDLNVDQEEVNPYDSDFDAGVEADENEDPKHYIEQLSGKLSQSLRSYQDGLPKPDADTAKYAAGMVIKAAIEGLSQEDVKDILSKLDDNENDEGDEVEFDGLECKTRNQNIIDELYNDVTQPKDNEDVQQIRNTKTSYKKLPFVSPKLN